jgi:endo-1,3-1,4-beta-glycanase ExoK
MQQVYLGLREMNTDHHSRPSLIRRCLGQLHPVPRPYVAQLAMQQRPTPMTARISAIVLSCAFVMFGAPSMLHAQSPEVSGNAFHDQFDALDRNVWFTSDGWTNGPHQNCDWSKQAVKVSDGTLKLSFLPGDSASGQGHLCGEIQTNAAYHHGTFEARIRSDAASGLNAAFFTYIGPVHKAPHDEIDVEILTRDTGRVSLNTFVNGKEQNGTTVPVDPTTDQAFHTYAFTWEPGSIRWFLDGKEVHRAADNLPVTPQKIYFSHWGTETLVDWMGPFTTPTAPLIMEVDWVAFTPLGTACQFPESVLCQTN